MHATAVLQKLIRRSIPSIHLKRLTTLIAVVDSALRGGRLTLSALARGLEADCSVRHRIKRVDRLLGNESLQDERLLIYRMLCKLLIGGQAEPIVIVDWSDLKTDRSLQLLRAAVWVHGFALPILEEVHPISRQHSPRVHRDFLLTLRMLLPEQSCPILVSDAGFRGPWFRNVEEMGWHWVGRVRNRTMVEWAGRWIPCKRLYVQATAKPRDLGEHLITRNLPLRVRLCVYRKAPQGRHHIVQYGNQARGSTSRKNAAREAEPWLIAASLSLHERTALDLINLYRKRMRIEHGFRALKSHQFGFAFEDSQSRSAERIIVLLMIHALALFLAWIAGLAAQRRGLQQRLQSNNDPSQTNFSIITLGWMALTMIRMRLSARDIADVLQSSPSLDSVGRQARL